MSCVDVTFRRLTSSASEVTGRKARSSRFAGTAGATTRLRARFSAGTVIFTPGSTGSNWMAGGTSLGSGIARRA